MVAVAAIENERANIANNLANYYEGEISKLIDYKESTKQNKTVYDSKLLSEWNTKRSTLGKSALNEKDLNDLSWRVQQFKNPSKDRKYNPDYFVKPRSLDVIVK